MKCHDEHKKVPFRVSRKVPKTVCDGNVADVVTKKQKSKNYDGKHRKSGKNDSDEHSSEENSSEED